MLILLLFAKESQSTQEKVEEVLLKQKIESNFQDGKMLPEVINSNQISLKTILITGAVATTILAIVAFVTNYLFKKKFKKNVNQNRKNKNSNPHKLSRTKDNNITYILG